MRFEGKHVAVSGASRGIGRAIALRLAAEGARVSLLARSREGLAETASQIGGAHVAPVDVRDRDAVDRAVAGAADANGPLFAFVAVSGPRRRERGGGRATAGTTSSRPTSPGRTGPSALRSATSSPARTRATSS